MESTKIKCVDELKLMNSFKENVDEKLWGFFQNELVYTHNLTQF